MIPKGWLSKPKCWGQVRRDIRKHNFDISIDPQGITKSAAIGWLSRAKTRVGIKGKWGREFSPWLNNKLVETKSSHLVDRSLELLSELEIAVPNSNKVEFGLPLCGESQISLEMTLAPNSLVELLGKYFAVINPGGSWPSKRWEMERYGSVASYLKTQHGMKSLIVWAGDQEREMAQQIHDFDTTASVIAPPTDLRELAVICHKAAFFLGGDTGPMHLASAMGTPCIGLYGTTRPEDSGAYGSQHIAIQKWYQSGNCRKRRSAANDAMRDILAGDVFSACDQMLNQLGLQAKVIEAA